MLGPRLFRTAHRLAAPSSLSRFRWSQRCSLAVATLGKKPKIQLLYGSQTGTAMQFAYDVEKAAQARGVAARVVDLEKVGEGLPAPMDDAADGTLNCFVVACFGSGEPTSNAENFYYWLMDPAREAERDKFANFTYCVFGLGQSQHYPERYQAVGKAIDKRLESLGATRFLPRGEGDAAGAQEEDLERWATGLWSALQEQSSGRPTSPSPEGPAAAPPAAAPAPPRKVVAPSPPPPSPQQEAQCAKAARVRKHTHTKPMMAKIAVARELNAPRSLRSNRHIEFAVDECEMPWTAGDYVGVVPQNDESLVQEIAQRLDLDLDYPLDPQKHSTLRRLPGDKPVRLGDAMKNYVDITGQPRKSVFRLLAEHTDSPAARRRLELIASASPLGRAEYADLVQGNQLTLVEALDLFPVFHLPEPVFFEMLPTLSPRFYSICTSPVAHPDRLGIVVSVVSYQTRLGRKHGGVCSQYLAHRRAGDEVPIFVKESLFRMPDDPMRPVIMVGAGTGVAPFRAFVEERMTLRASGQQVGPMSLFFGIGHVNEDYLYRGLLEGARREGLLDLHIAAGFDVVYHDFVQHQMLDPANAVNLWDLVDRQGANVYVCGSSKTVGPAVHAALVQIACDQGGLSEEDATAYVRRLQEGARYQMDVF